MWSPYVQFAVISVIVKDYKKGDYKDGSNQRKFKSETDPKPRGSSLGSSASDKSSSPSTSGVSFEDGWQEHRRRREEEQSRERRRKYEWALKMDR